MDFGEIMNKENIVLTKFKNILKDAGIAGEEFYEVLYSLYKKQKLSVDVKDVDILKVFEKKLLWLENNISEGDQEQYIVDIMEEVYGGIVDEQFLKSVESYSRANNLKDGEETKLSLLIKDRQKQILQLKSLEKEMDTEVNVLPKLAKRREESCLEMKFGIIRTTSHIEFWRDNPDYKPSDRTPGAERLWQECLKREQNNVKNKNNREKTTITVYDHMMNFFNIDLDKLVEDIEDVKENKELNEDKASKNIGKR